MPSHDVRRRRIRETWRALCALVLIALAYLVWATISGCSCCDDDEDQTAQSTQASQQQAQQNPRKVSIVGDRSVVNPGQRVRRQLVAEGPSGQTVKVLWTPPNGATNITFGTPPDTPDGPPYTWSNIETVGDVTTIEYDAPALPPGEDAEFATETAVTSYGGLAFNMQAFSYIVCKEAPRPQAEVAHPARQTHSTSDLGDGLVTIWQLDRWIDLPGVALTSEACRDYFEWLMDEQAFFAVRLPVEASVVPTRSVAVPVFADDEHPAKLALVQYFGLVEHYVADLEPRQGRMGFAANALPSAEGEVWVTMGVSPDSPPVPDGIALGADEWGMRSTLWVDLSAQPDAGDGLVQPLYYCYEGSEQPQLTRRLQRMAVALGYRREGGLAVSNYADWCITCIGPQSIAFVDETTDWAFSGDHSDFVEVGQAMRFSHLLLGGPGGATQVTFEISSTLDLGWQLVEGDYDAPNMGRPITGPKSVGAHDLAHVWLVSEDVPEGTADGPYSVHVMAENAAGETRRASSLFWVGEWVAPPTPQPTLTPQPTPTLTPTDEPGRHLCVPLILAGR